MTHTLTLPGKVYRKLAQGAAERGMTIESLLAVVSDLVDLPNQPTEQEQTRIDRLEQLLGRFRSGNLNAEDCFELDHLIDEDYCAANVRADRLIQAKLRSTKTGKTTGSKSSGTSPAGKSSRK